MHQKNKRTFGSLGEDKAVVFLKNNNFEILERNFRFSRLGEIDIIAKENEYICFIEVKTRSSIFFGTPAESVNMKKQNQIRKIAQVYIGKYKLHDSFIRFDVIEVIASKSTNGIEVKSIEIIRDAF